MVRRRDEPFDVSVHFEYGFCAFTRLRSEVHRQVFGSPSGMLEDFRKASSGAVEGPGVHLCDPRGRLHVVGDCASGTQGRAIHPGVPKRHVGEGCQRPVGASPSSSETTPTFTNAFVAPFVIAVCPFFKVTSLIQTLPPLADSDTWTTMVSPATDPNFACSAEPLYLKVRAPNTAGAEPSRSAAILPTFRRQCGFRRERTPWRREEPSRSTGK